MADWKEGFAELCAKTHSEQAKWWLNGFWEDGAKDYADKLWDITHHFIELDVGFPILYGRKMREYKEGCDLDEIKSHHILEKLGETMTVIALRKRLKELDIDNNKRMALSEYLLDKYKKTPEELVNAPQGNINPDELKAAEDAFAAATEALDKSAAEAELAAAALAEAKKTAAEAASTLAAAEAAAEEAATALAAAQAAAAEAAAALAEAQKTAAAAAVAAEEAATALAAATEAKENAAEAHAKVKAATDLVKAAEAELQASIDEITRLEQEKADKIAKFQAIIDSDAGTVKKGQAVSQKAALESEDELPLRKAKITQGAALKKVEKERKAAQAVEDECADVLKKAADAEAASAAAKAKADEAKAAADAAEADSTAKKAAADAAEAESAAAKQKADDTKAAADAAKVAADEAEAASAAAKIAADEAFAAAEVALKDAETKLEELKKGSGTPNGNVYWMEKTLAEKKKFMK